MKKDLKVEKEAVFRLSRFMKVVGPLKLKYLLI